MTRAQVATCVILVNIVNALFIFILTIYLPILSEVVGWSQIIWNVLVVCGSFTEIKVLATEHAGKWRADLLMLFTLSLSVFAIGIPFIPMPQIVSAAVVIGWMLFVFHLIQIAMNWADIWNEFWP